MVSGDLVGVWRLVSFHDLDEEGGRREGPLGANPYGLLFYSATGNVSVSMMRTTVSDHADPAPQSYMSYAGTWRRAGNRVFHTITVAPEPAWLGTEQVRELVLDDDRLTLYGTSLTTPRRRALEWRRIGQVTS